MGRTVYARGGGKGGEEEKIKAGLRNSMRCLYWYRMACCEATPIQWLKGGGVSHVLLLLEEVDDGLEVALDLALAQVGFGPDLLCR